MTGILPNEGEYLIANLLCKNADADRGTNLQLLLYTNSSISETTTAAELTEPTGGGYARKTLTDGDWTVTGDTAEYANQTFIPSGAAYSGAIYGCAIVTAGTTPRIISICPDMVNITPITLGDGVTYTITPKIVVA